MRRLFVLAIVVTITGCYFKVSESVGVTAPASGSIATKSDGHSLEIRELRVYADGKLYGLVKPDDEVNIVIAGSDEGTVFVNGVKRKPQSTEGQEAPGKQPDRRGS
jgi:hypothetical protein